MILGFVVLVQGLTTPSPLTTEAEMSGEYPERARNINQRFARGTEEFFPVCVRAEPGTEFQDLSHAPVLIGQNGNNFLIPF